MWISIRYGCFASSAVYGLEAKQKLSRLGASHFSLLVQRKVTAESIGKRNTPWKRPMQQCFLQLDAEEQGVVMAMKLEHASARAIARALGRAPSTITRELRRNGYMAACDQGVIGRPRIAGG
ncbi:MULTISPECIES: helix-turn-helix domain-containing protein [Xanthomonas translucens group]|uniref:helix-turn-helix domain-containing protein n=1 Tax=Xanthomonas translucens group TaxID=3390202 RepID=UPI001364DC1E|nr:helix-turn-helix domain-containing protein [Xanthomonas translucens]UKE71097.1 helix-turn-helix domain-containing protein [Xanthomonas translucens pv. pistacia]